MLQAKKNAMGNFGPLWGIGGNRSVLSDSYNGTFSLWGIFFSLWGIVVSVCKHIWNDAIFSKKRSKIPHSGETIYKSKIKKEGVFLLRHSFIGATDLKKKFIGRGRSFSKSAAMGNLKREMIYICNYIGGFMPFPIGSKKFPIAKIFVCKWLISLLDINEFPIVSKNSP